MARPASHALAETTVVDTDVHITVEEDALVPYLDEPYRSSITESPHPIFPSSSWDQRMGGKIDDHISTFTGPEEVREFQEQFAIDYPIVNTFEPLGKFSQPDLAMALMRAYNDLLLDVFLDDYDFLGLAAVATQKPQEAAGEIDRVADEDGVVGIYLGTSGEYPPLGDPSNDPIYRAAADNDLPVVFHGNGDEFQFDFPHHNKGFNNYFEVQTLGHPWQQMATMSSLLGEGVPEKFPELNFIFLEAGIGWVPYMMHRMNKIYRMRRSEVPLLEKSPEEYVRDQFYIGSQPLGEPNDPEDMKRMIETLGADMLMFATDYPHWDFDHLEELDKYLQHYFTSEERQQILHDTPIEAFKLDI